VTTYVFDNLGRVYIAQRSPSKAVDPMKYEAPSHGRVSSGESYEDAAKRETFEEL
jgi:8-oxo-dGTP pyrophosphatase MutT (NUDIX family)